jgi:hypothetical protein
MKTRIINYVFNKTAKTVTFSDYTSIALESVLLITNATDNLIIYNFADPLKGGTVVGNILTLAYDTSSMANTDKLQIFYDDLDKTATAAKQDAIISQLKGGITTDTSTIGGDPVVTPGPGIQGVALVDSSGDPINDLPGGLPVTVTNVVKTIIPTVDIPSLRAGNVNDDLVPIMDVSNYATAYLQILGTWVGTFTFQGSDDGGTFSNVLSFGYTTKVPMLTTTVNDLIEIPLGFKYLRVRMTAWTSGSAQGVLRLTTVNNNINTNLPMLLRGTAYESQIGAVDAANTIGTGIPPAAIMGQFDDVTPTKITEDQFGNVRMSKSRMLYTQIKSTDPNNENGQTILNNGETLVHDESGEQTLADISDKLDNLADLIDGIQRPLLDGQFGRRISVIANDRNRIKTTSLTLSNTTNETTIIPANQCAYNDILAVIITNTSGTQNTRVDFRDTTSGNVIFSLQSIGGAPPAVLSLGGVAIPQTVKGSNWTVQCGTAIIDCRLLIVYSVN